MTTLKPVGANQIYVSGSNEVLERLATEYSPAPGYLFNHTVTAIFTPVNDTNLVLVVWQSDGFNIVPREAVRIFNTETREMEDAWITEPA